MKRGAAPKFKELGSSPAKQNTDALVKAAKQKADELLAYTRKRGDLEMKPPYKRPTGPIEDDSVPLSPGFEDPEKIQTLQAKGLMPGSQEFNKKVQTASDYKKFSNLEKYDDDK